MLSFLTVLYVAVVVILLFGASIFIHEFGHFWVARLRGLKVEEFAIGFGPKIFGWTRNGVAYTCRWFPFGGYVKLPQMVTSEVLEGATTESLPPISRFSKILVAFAGPLMNVVFAYFIATIIYFVGLPVSITPAVVGTVDPTSPEGQVGIREKDRIVSVNNEPVKSWNDVQMAAIIARTNVVPVVVQRGTEKLTFQLPLKMNKTLQLKMLDLDPLEYPVVRSVIPDKPAEKAGLQTNDVFVSFANVPVGSQEQLVGLIRKRAGEPTEMVVKRGDKRITLNVTPSGTPGKNEGQIGVMLSSSSVYYEVQHPTPQDQVALVWGRTIDTLGALFHSKQTGVGVKDLSGPPGILAMLAAQVLTDLRLALSFLVLLNINLAVLNLLPIPVLDGGHILVAVIEGIIRRTLNVKVVEWVTTGCALLLISFILFVSFNDLTLHREWFKMMFQHTTKIEQPANKVDSAKSAPKAESAPQPAAPAK